MICPCDRLIHPEPPDIDAGLRRIPRRIADFSDFRRAMLAGIRAHGALEEWQARDEDDLGVMLLEMWAYVCDVLAAHDEAIAHETYLRTALRRPSLRRLAELVGHLPRPAAGARVVLAALADGDRPVDLPPGTAFRSKAFDGEAPQVFELDGPATITPAHNRWRIGPRRTETMGEVPGPGGESGGPGGDSGVGTGLHLDAADASVREGEPLVLSWSDGDDVRAVRALRAEQVEDAGGEALVRVALDGTPDLSGVEPGELRVEQPTQAVGLWIPPSGSGDGPGSGDGELTDAIRLDGIQKQVRAGDVVVLARRRELRWFRVDAVDEVLVEVTAGGPTVVDDGSGDTVTVTPPPVEVPVTRLHLDREVNDPDRRGAGGDWERDGAITVHFGLVEAGDVRLPTTTRPGGGPAPLVAPDGGPLRGSAAEDEVEPPSRVLAEGARGVARDVEATVDLDEGTISGVSDPDLTLPVDVFGNRLEATRGETVEDELLGRGDGSVEQQSFELAKKPLTYLPDPSAENEDALSSTLEVRIDGIRWREERTFFGTDPDDRVYIVRRNDEGTSVVTFRGPLPTDAEVTASYRFGAGAAAPAPGGVSQLAKPVEGLRSVRNPRAAFGGGDAEGPEELRTEAAASALLLGRAISLPDFEARAASQTGVRAVRVGWRWLRKAQRPGVVVRYVGDEGVAGEVAGALRRVTDPAVAIDVRPAVPVPLRLVLDVAVAPDDPEDDVVRAVRRELADPDDGLLSPAAIGIGVPLFRSRIFERALRAEGASSVDGLRYDTAPFGATRPFSDAALDPREHDPEGRDRSYFDVEAGGLVINGREGPRG